MPPYQSCFFGADYTGRATGHEEMQQWHTPTSSSSSVTAVLSMCLNPSNHPAPTAPSLGTPCSCSHCHLTKHSSLLISIHLKDTSKDKGSGFKTFASVHSKAMLKTPQMLVSTCWILSIISPFAML